MRTVLIACAAATLMSASPRAARAQDSVSFGLMVGGEEVGGAFRDGHSFQHGVAGVVVGALAQFPLSSPRLSLRAGVSAYATSFADDNITEMHPGHIARTGGIGLESHVRKATFFAELRYMAMPPGALEPLTIGIRF
jgi:hypothetical protein